MEDIKGNEDKKKPHRERHSGRKADKKKTKNQHVQEQTDKQRNPKAFTFNSAVRAERRFRRAQDIQTKKQHVPVIDRTPLEPPPIMVVVVGPPKVGKSTLIQCLVKTFTRQPLSAVKGPVTVVSGKRRRITLMECNNDINSMIDLAKVADLVLLLIDASFGFEMEIFEFLNICQVHGMPKVMGVLTHLDLLKKAKTLKQTKKVLKHRFWTEVYAGAKLFYLSGLLHGEYLRNEVKNLGRFISVMKFRPLTWQTTHSYLLADRMEDLTSPELIRLNPKVDRTVSLYGYVRGIPLNKSNSIHIPGCGDSVIGDLSFLPDPCPLPDKLKKRTLVDKERLIYAPFSGVGGIVYDKDAVYMELAGSHSHHNQVGGRNESEQELVTSLLETKNTLDSKIAKSQLQIFSNTAPITAEDFEMNSQQTNVKNGITEMSVTNPDDGRKRRKAIFESSGEEKCISDEEDASSGDDESGASDDEDGESDETGDSDNTGEEASDDSSAEDNDEDIENVIVTKKRKIHNEEQKKASECDSEDSSADEEDTAVNWKQNLAQKAADSFIERQNSVANLWKLVYGQNASQEKQKDSDTDNEEESSGLFRIGKKSLQKIKEKDIMNNLDVSKNIPHHIRDWSTEQVREIIKDCFVTGKWKDTEDANELLRLDDMSMDDDDDDDVYGDFEDLETGEKHSTKNGKGKVKSEDNSDEEDTDQKEDKVLSKTELLEKKQKLKEKFNAEYDEKDGEDNAFYDGLKKETSMQAELNRSQFEGLDDAVRVQLEGFRAGMYVRVELESIPCELVTHFDPTYPLIVGGLQPGEENVGYVKVRIKKHRWYNHILKTRNPLIISMGWRRFQTLAVYSKLEDDLRHRMLKYTPEHVVCMAHFWGPITRPNTGFLAVQDVATKEAGFRIVATGSVVDCNKSTEVTKKLKLTGVPLKIYKKTAFIKGMFNSALEVAKFEGARIKTVSGIRGIIKKAMSKPEGSFRATFEDKIQLSDIVFCRTWYVVEIPKLYNPVTSLLMPPDQKNLWRGMKTVGQLKRERGLHNEPQKDSLYTPIVREPVAFPPLMIPKKLQKNLPFKDKVKVMPKKNKTVAVVRDSHESKVASMMRKLKIIYNQKQKEERKAKVKRLADFKKQIKGEELKKHKRLQKVKKDVFRTLSKTESKKPKF